MKHSNQKNHQTIYVGAALSLGLLFGHVLNLHYADDPIGLSYLNGIFAALIDIFFRLIKMILAPLVFATLVVGMANMGDIQTVGRIGLKSIAWFFFASVLSLLLGMLLVNLFEPGVMLHLDLPVEGVDLGLDKNKPSLAGFISHVFPKSIFEAMASNEILQIVVFSVFFGVACASLGELASPMVKMLDALAHIMLKITSYAMHYAPVAIFAAMASIVSRQGIGILKSYGLFIAEFYFGLILLCSILCCLGFLIIGKKVISLLSHIREPILLAFGTASSESAYPKLLVQLERFGCEERITGFVLPLGYSFNLDGSMMYMTFAVLFIAQAYGIHMPFSEQLFMLLVLLFTSKGIAGVPRASLIVIGATLSMFHIPEAGLLLLLGIDQILDMGRSATNVVGNSIASAIVCRWEKALR